MLKLYNSFLKFAGVSLRCLVIGFLSLTWCPSVAIFVLELLYTRVIVSFGLLQLFLQLVNFLGFMRVGSALLILLSHTFLFLTQRTDASFEVLITVFKFSF